MATFLTILLHVLLIGSLIVFVGCGILVVFRTNSSIERLIRLGAWFSGAMVVIGAQAAGLSFADFTVNALSGTRPASDVAKIFGAVVPGALGVGLATYLTSSVRRSDNIAVRVLAFVGMLAASQFAEIYAAATSAHGMNVGAAAIPNLSFVVGIVMYIVLTWDPEDRTKRSSWRALLAIRLRRPAAQVETQRNDEEPSAESMFRGA